MTLMRSLLLVLGLLVTASGFANPYYGEDFLTMVNNGNVPTKGLRKRLRQILTSAHLQSSDAPDILLPNCPATKKCSRHKLLSYREARVHLYNTLHLQSDDNGPYIKDVYCQRKFYVSELGSPLKGRVMPSSKIMNCEHTWPQSKFKGSPDQAYQRSDLHHLFPSDSYLNSKRGRFEFAEVSRHANPLKCGQSYLGEAAEVKGPHNPQYSQFGSSYFEPPHEHKGNVARAIFYFSTRYNSPISPTEEYFLKKWHREDPVDAAERVRNQKVMEIQGTRNPFIDFPELVSLVADF